MMSDLQMIKNKRYGVSRFFFYLVDMTFYKNQIKMLSVEEKYSNIILRNR